MWTCKDCNSSIDDDINFCYNCGEVKESANGYINDEENKWAFNSNKIYHSWITTSNSFEVHEITNYIGPIRANIVIGVNYFADVIASITDVLGGKSHIYK